MQRVFIVLCVGRAVLISYGFLKENIVYTLQIRRAEVDTFKIGKRIPSCQLIAECETEQPTTLEHIVTLSGAKAPHNTFTIYRHYDSGT